MYFRGSALPTLLGPSSPTLVCAALGTSSPILSAGLGPAFQLCCEGLGPSTLIARGLAPLQLCLRGARPIFNFVCAGLCPSPTLSARGSAPLQLCLRRAWPSPTLYAELSFPSNCLQSSPALPSHTYFFPSHIVSYAVMGDSPRQLQKRGKTLANFFPGIGPVCRSLKTHHPLKPQAA